MRAALSSHAIKVGVLAPETHWWDSRAPHQTRCGIRIRAMATADIRIARETEWAELTDEPVMCLLCLGAL